MKKYPISARLIWHIWCDAQINCDMNYLSMDVSATKSNYDHHFNYTNIHIGKYLLSISILRV